MPKYLLLLEKVAFFLPCFIFISGYWIAIESYTARSEDELSYRAGDEVEVLATSNLGWWKIR